MDQDVPSMPFSTLTAGYGDDDDDAPCQVCPTNDHFHPVTETMTGDDNDDDMDCVKPLLVLTDKMAVSLHSVSSSYSLTFPLAFPIM